MNPEHNCVKTTDNRCAICEVGATLNFSTDIEYVREKLLKAQSLLNEAKEDIKGNLKHSISFVKDEINIQIDSMKAELDKIRENMFAELDSGEKDVLALIETAEATIDAQTAELHDLQEALNKNLNRVQEIFDLKYNITFHETIYEIRQKEVIGLIKYEINKIMPDKKWIYLLEEFTAEKNRCLYTFSTEPNISYLKSISNGMFAYQSDNEIYIRNVNNGICVKSIKEGANKLLVLPDCRLIAYIKNKDAAKTKKLQIWDTKTFESDFIQIDNTVLCFDHLRNEKLICAEKGIDENKALFYTIAIYAIDNLRFKKLSEFKHKDLRDAECSKVLPGDLLALGHWNGEIVLWNYKEMTLDKRLGSHYSKVNDLKHLRPEDLLISCSRDMTAKIWNYRTGECMRVMQEEGKIKCIRFIPSNVFFVCLVDDTIRFYDRKTYECVKTISKELIQDMRHLNDIVFLDSNHLAAKSLRDIKVFYVKC